MLSPIFRGRMQFMHGARRNFTIVRRHLKPNSRPCDSQGLIYSFKNSEIILVHETSFLSAASEPSFR